MAWLIGSDLPGVQRIAVPAVCTLIFFLAFGTQWLFMTAGPELAPGPLTTRELYFINILLVCILYTYYKACTVDPGRYVFPPAYSKRTGTDKKTDEDYEDEGSHQGGNENAGENRKTTGSAGTKSNAASALASSSPFSDGRRSYCKKCALPKPPRAHHCKTCRRCVPRMDHHCPWTGNCVSLQTFPHFLRFLTYANAGVASLLYLHWQRFAAVWAARHLPAYLGPTHAQLGWLTVLFLVAGVTELFVGILLFTTVRGWAFNTTMIEGWEIERHEAVLERRGTGDDEGGWWRRNGGGGGGGGGGYDEDEFVEPVEFPYDIGVFENMAQAMGNKNVLFWFLPFADGPIVSPFPSSSSSSSSSSTSSPSSSSNPVAVGWAYEENGLNDREGMWPPLDPDKVRHARVWRQRKRELGAMRAEFEAVGGRAHMTPQQEREAFRRRQELDLRRWRGRMTMVDELEEVPPRYVPGAVGDSDGEEEEELGQDGVENDTHEWGRRQQRPGVNIVVDEGKSGWVNADGEKLGDYGVDSDAEFDDDDILLEEEEEEGGLMGQALEEDDDVPLAELIRRRKVLTKDDGETC